MAEAKQSNTDVKTAGTDPLVEAVDASTDFHAVGRPGLISSKEGVVDPKPEDADENSRYSILAGPSQTSKRVGLTPAARTAVEENEGKNINPNANSNVAGRIDSDEQLVTRVRSGDATAGETLVRRHHDNILRYLNRLTGSSHVAEELTQQTWLSAFQHLDQFRHMSTAQQSAARQSSQSSPVALSFKAWLFRIATNKANDLWRTRGRQRSAYQGLGLVVDQVEPDASVPLHDIEQHQKLRNAIEELPALQKQIVMLRYYSGLKFVEIAEVVGCPLNTALGRMHKALLKLKSALIDDS